jgi:hypothetical protein
MKTSDSVTKIAAALIKVQKSITFAQTDSNNPFFKSKYADLPTVIDAVKPQLNDNDIVYIQTPSPSEPGTLALTTRLLHSSGEWLEDTAIVPLPKADPQGYGSAMTYARRYSLAAITGLYQDDDDGNAASINGKGAVAMPKAKIKAEVDPGDDYAEEAGEAPENETGDAPAPVKTNEGKITKKQQGLIFVKLRNAGIGEDEFKAYLLEKFSLQHTADLGWKDMKTVLTWIEAYHP